MDGTDLYHEIIKQTHCTKTIELLLYPYAYTLGASVWKLTISKAYDAANAVFLCALPCI